MTRTVLTIFYIVWTSLCYSQTFDQSTINAKSLIDFSNKIKNDPNIDASQAISLISNFNTFPKIDKLGIEYLFFYTDSLFGEIPVRVYVPNRYDNTKSNPVILLLHGAEGQSRFSFVDRKLMKYISQDSIDYTNDFFVDFLKNENSYIIIRPIADVTKDFRWAVNRSELTSTPTIKTLTDIVIYLKRFLNIDDNRVYSWGHSDGSDGTFALAVLKPAIFAGFVGYNSMLTQILGQVYPRNMKNKPFYLVHSDLDDLRPIQQTRLQVKTLDSLKAPVIYKEYLGYSHDDKHLDLDAQNAKSFIQSVTRNPYPKTLIWESENSLYNQIDWLKIKTLSTEDNAETWHKDINQKGYNRVDKKFDDWDYYIYKNKSGAVIAEFNNNTFIVKTSRVDEIELFISPVMVNLQNPVIVEINGKIMYNRKIDADKSFLLSEFNKNYDRKIFWVNSITVNTK